MYCSIRSASTKPRALSLSPVLFVVWTLPTDRLSVSVGRSRRRTWDEATGDHQMTARRRIATASFLFSFVVWHFLSLHVCKHYHVFDASLYCNPRVTSSLLICLRWELELSVSYPIFYTSYRKCLRRQSKPAQMGSIHFHGKYGLVCSKIKST